MNSSLTKKQEDYIAMAIKNATDPLSAIIKVLQAENMELKQAVQELKNQNANVVNKPLFTSFFKENIGPEVGSTKQLSEPAIDLMNAMNSENNEILKKENNLIIFGLKNTNDRDDELLVGDLFNSIGSDKKDIIKLFRFKSTNSDKPAPICVMVKSKQLRNQVLVNAKKLQSSNEFKDVFINVDQTKNQRIIFNKLKLEKEKLNSENKDNSVYFVIRDAKIKKIKNYPNRNENYKANEESVSNSSSNQ